MSIDVKREKEIRKREAKERRRADRKRQAEIAKLAQQLNSYIKNGERDEVVSG